MDKERDEETAYTEDDIDLEDLYSRYALHYPEESAQTEPDKKESEPLCYANSLQVREKRI